MIEESEPKLYKAVTNIFFKSYEYMRKYRQFKNTNKGKKETEETSEYRQMDIFDYEEGGAE